ncbi:50S ribosomal protein L9 [Bradyrhizobium sp. USDA 4353]
MAAARRNVILLEPVPSLGEIGDVVPVRPGFARNFLFPRRLAVYATAHNVVVFEDERARLEEVAKAKRHQAEQDRIALADLPLTYVANAMAGDVFYGSLGAKKIARMVSLQGIDVKSQQIRLPNPINTFGSHRVAVNLFADIVGEIEVHVVRTEADAKEFAEMASQARQDRAVSLLERVASKTSASSDESANLAEIAALVGDELGALTAKAVAEKSLSELQSCVSRLLAELDVNCLASFTCSPDDSDDGILNAKMTVLGSLSVDVGSPATVRVADPAWLLKCEPRLSLFSLHASVAGPAKQYKVTAVDGTVQAIVVEQSLRLAEKNRNSDRQTEIWASAYVNGTCVQRGVWAV